MGGWVGIYTSLSEASRAISHRVSAPWRWGPALIQLQEEEEEEEEETEEEKGGRRIVLFLLLVYRKRERYRRAVAALHLLMGSFLFG